MVLRQLTNNDDSPRTGPVASHHSHGQKNRAIIHVKNDLKVPFCTYPQNSSLGLSLAKPNQELESRATREVHSVEASLLKNLSGRTKSRIYPVGNRQRITRKFPLIQQSNSDAKHTHKSGLFMQIQGLDHQRSPSHCPLHRPDKHGGNHAKSE